MLRFSYAQLEQLTQLETADYLVDVRAQLIRTYPALSQDPRLLERLQRAYQVAQQWGLQDEGVLRQFMQVEAIAPDFYRQAAIHAWLTKSGASAQERWGALWQVVQKQD